MRKSKKGIRPGGNQIFIKSIWSFGQNISKWTLRKDFWGSPKFSYCFWITAAWRNMEEVVVEKGRKQCSKNY